MKRLGEIWEFCSFVFVPHEENGILEFSKSRNHESKDLRNIASLELRIHGRAERGLWNYRITDTLYVD